MDRNCIHFVIGTFISTTAVISMSAGCGVVCIAAVLIAMVTIYLHLKRKKRSSYNDGMCEW